MLDSSFLWICQQSFDHLQNYTKGLVAVALKGNLSIVQIQLHCIVLVLSHTVLVNNKPVFITAHARVDAVNNYIHNYQHLLTLGP